MIILPSEDIHTITQLITLKQAEKFFKQKNIKITQNKNEIKTPFLQLKIFKIKNTKYTQPKHNITPINKTHNNKITKLYILLNPNTNIKNKYTLKQTNLITTINLNTITEEIIILQNKPYNINITNSNV